MPRPHNTPPPSLQTLHAQPSWHNRAGRVDRSACFTVTASQLWRRIPEDQWTYRLGLRPEVRGLSESSPQASKLKPHHFAKPDRTAELTLWARDLWLLHKFEPPKRIQGDYRTSKSNAMQVKGLRPEERGLSKHSPQASPLKPQPSVNPNRGVGFSMGLKMLGLDCLWQTTLKIERIIQHAKLKQHFLICPMCGAQNTPRRGHFSGPAPSTSSTSSTAHGRATKLYLPLCTEQEYEDAKRAQLWLRSTPQAIHHPNRPLNQEAIQLIER